MNSENAAIAERMMRDMRLMEADPALRARYEERVRRNVSAMPPAPTTMAVARAAAGALRRTPSRELSARLQALAPGAWRTDRSLSAKMRNIEDKKRRIAEARAAEDRALRARLNALAPGRWNSNATPEQKLRRIASMQRKLRQRRRS